MTVVCQSIECLRENVSRWRRQGETIAFVPTMGNLHAGHLSLIKLAQQKADRVVVSIYVNPMQFAPDEDFDSYPRTLEQDIESLDQMATDMVFTPETKTIYPQGESMMTTVDVPGISDILEGEFRPGFFRGVATVVLKLFNMVRPDIAVFGEKDYQQLLIIRRLVEDFDLAIEIIGAEIVREADGLAMSSRNRYLSDTERRTSVALSNVLQACRAQINTSEIPLQAALDRANETLVDEGFTVDYLTLRETGSLQPVSNDELTAGQPLVLLAAAKIGDTRLLDNLKFNYKSQ